jgi:glutathione S-transferase
LIKLHGAILSPYVRKVKVVLAMKGIEYDSTFQMPFNQGADFFKISPLGKIPALEHGDLKISDSTVICEYLEDLYPKTPIYPTKPVDRAWARWLVTLGGTKVTELTGGIFFQRFMRVNVLQQSSDEVLVGKIINEQLPPILDYLETQAPQAGFLFGDFGLADISLVSPFVNAGYGGYFVDEDRWPNFKRFAQRVQSHALVSHLLDVEAKLVPQSK